MSLDYRGDLREQDWDVQVDVATGDLVVAMNGEVFARLQLPPSKWRELRAGATAVLLKDTA